MSRICFISPSAYGYFNEDVPAGGGAQRQFYLLSTSITDTFEVHFIVGDYGQSQNEHRKGIQLHRAYTPDHTSPIYDKFIKFQKLYGAIKRADADVYVLRGSPEKVAVIFPLIKTLRKALVYHVPVDSYVEPPLELDPVRKRLYIAALPRLKKIITQTQYQSDQLEQHWNVSSTIIPNGYPPADVVDTHDSRKHFLWVGRLNKSSKRPHRFLDVADSVPDHQFVLIGIPEDKKYSNKIRQRAKNTPNVTYAGQIKPSKIHKYYRRAIALLNTSTNEGFPNTFLEAWRYATPVLSLEYDPNRFLGTDSYHGFADSNFSRFVSLTEQIGESPELRRELGSLSMEVFTERYQLSRIVDSYKTVLSSTLENK